MTDDAKITYENLADHITAKGISITFQNVRRSGSRILGTINIKWEERIAGQRIVLVDISKDFDVEGRQRIFEDQISIGFGLSVKVWVDVYVDANPDRVCIEYRATWPGGNVGDRKCHNL